ncbi:E3 ubiquitin-protein ligase TRIM56-like [Amphiura filiformis]|uniref:E3 ubiquitin-protein ligase TRIM56-like n=1 Tax=Amphiura filiformis TaxID=82378 RepID=UPI003B20BBBC
MAESRLVKNLSRDHLECGICLHQYKKPRRLPCLHCFCHNCLERYCKGQTQVVCPNIYCKKPTAIPKEGVSGFPPHFIINTLQETLDKAKQTMKDAVCGNCNLKKKATAYCLDCEEFFCQTCHTAHDTLKTHKDHQVVSIEDVRSGKVVLPVTASEDQKCKDHDSETKKFYCETCGKLICGKCIVLGHPQHQVITLKKASEEKVEKLKELSKGSEDLEIEYRDAIKKTEDVQKSLATASKEVKKNLQRVKNEYYKQVDAIFKKHEVDVRLVDVQNAKELNHIKDNLQTTLAKLECARDLATKVTQMGSDHDITSIFPTLSASLKELNEMTKPVAASDSLGYVGFIAPDTVDIPDMCSVLSFKDKWVLIRRFSTKAGLSGPWGIAVNHDDDMSGPWGITVNHDDDIAVTNGYNKTCKVFSKDGNIKYIFQGPLTTSLVDIAITSDSWFVLPGKGQIQFYDSQGKTLTDYPNTPTYDMLNQPSTPRALTVDSSGRIIAGLRGNTISIHHEDGRLISKFATSGMPNWLAVTYKEDIAVVIDNTLQLMDYCGNNVRVLQPPLQVTEWMPYGVCCSKQGEIFVVNLGSPKAVYRYTADGEQCLGCVITGLHYPMGIAISDERAE